jgi:hypothetical protein
VAALTSEASGQRGDASEVRAHSASEDARKRADDTRPEPGSSARAALTQRPVPHAVEHLYLTDPIADLGHIDGVMFSGGVGEYVYGREARDFGDMGRRLGQAIRRRATAGR